MKIPATFQLLGCTYVVGIVARKDWKFADDEVGMFDPLSKTIYIRKESKALMQHTFLHEVVHAILGAMNHSLYESEDFVDLFSGLLHQALLTAE